MDSLLECAGLLLIGLSMLVCIAFPLHRSNIVFTPLILLFIGCCMYYLVPFLAGALLGLTTPERWGEAVFLHSVYLSLWLLTFLLSGLPEGMPRPGLAGFRRTIGLLPWSSSAVAIGGALCLAICIARVSLYRFSLYAADEYIEASAYSSFDKYLVERLVYLAAPLAALAIVALIVRGRWILALPLLAGFAVYLKILLGGAARLLVAEPLLFVFFSLLFFRKRLAAWFTLGACLFMIVAIGPIVQMSRHRIVKDGITYARIDATEMLLQKPPAQILRETLETIVMRSDAIDNTVVLFDRLNSPERFAWHKPYRGFLFRWIPRFLYPERPFAGSIDNSITGCLPQVLCGYILGTDSGGLTAFGGMMMYWQFGWTGVVLGALVCGALCRLWLDFMFSYGALGFALFLAASNHLVFVNTPCSLDQFLEAVLTPTAYLGMAVLVTNLLSYFIKSEREPKNMEADGQTSCSR